MRFSRWAGRGHASRAPVTPRLQFAAGSAARRAGLLEGRRPMEPRSQTAASCAFASASHAEVVLRRPGPRSGRRAGEHGAALNRVRGARANSVEEGQRSEWMLEQSAQRGR